jgi:hypothetical protein
MVVCGTFTKQPAEKMESQPSPLDNIDIKSFFNTVKPVLRGHLWDK